MNESQINEISEKTDGFSGADMKNLCQEAALGPIRAIDDFESLLSDPMALSNVRPISIDDFYMALKRVKASVSKDDLDQYLNWNKVFGSGT